MSKKRNTHNKTKSIAELEFFNSRAATDQLIKHINDQVITAQIDNTLLKNSGRPRETSLKQERNTTIPSYSGFELR